MHRQTPLKVELFASALRKIILGVLAVFACLILLLSHNPVKTSAATNGTLNFQARLESNTGAIAPDGTYNVQFKLYDASTGGTNLWTESYLNSASQGVIVTNGYLTVNLGSITSFPTTINWDQSLYVTMNIGGTSGTASWDGEMNPRLKLTAVPYAFQAKSASQLQQIQGAYSGTLNFNTLTDNRTISLPDENGTVCLQTSTSCGFLTTSAANSSYIQLQGTTPGTAQTGNFNISGTGIAATLQGTSAVLSPLFDTPTAGVLNIGTTNATAINLNKNVTVISNQKLSLGGALAYQSSGGGAISFAAPVTYSANQARYASEADFNNDGYNDIVTSDVQNNLAYVLINNGDGTFKPAVSYSTGGYPEWIGYADVNKDGFQDIISSNSATNNVSVLINKGDGTFYSAATYTVGGSPKSANAVDINNDGYPDMVVSNSTDNNVSVLMNNGDGTFASAVNYSLPASSAPKYAAIVDVNGDGHPDIVTANSGTNNVSVLLNSGSGTFGTPVNYAVGTNPRSAKVVDLNHDGHPDIVAVNATDHTISILLNNGDGTFGTQTTHDVGAAGYPVGVDVADINGDGNVDIVTANSGNNTISIFPGNGDGTFGTQTLISSGEPRSMNVADVNNDGKLDIVAPDFSGNNVAVLINTTTMSNHSSILSVNTGLAGNTGLIIQGNTGQVADLLRLQTTGGSLLFNVNSSGHGNFASTVSGANAVNANDFITLGQAQTLMSGTSAGAILLQATTPGTQQTGNFNISGTGIASSLLSGSLDVSSSGTLNIGTTKATAINIGSINAVTSFSGQIQSTAGISFLGTMNTANNTRLYFGGTLASSTTTTQYGIQNSVTFNPQGASLSSIYAFVSTPTLGGSSLNIANYQGAAVGISTTSGYTGQVAKGTGINVVGPSISGSQLMGAYTGVNIATNSANSGNTTGTINNTQLSVAGITAGAGTGGTVNNYGINLTLPSGTGGTTNNYGLYVQGNGASSTNYSIYNASSAASYYAGKVGIGTTAPAYLLDVSGGTGVVGQFSGRVIGAAAVGTNEFTTLSQVTSMISASSSSAVSLQGTTPGTAQTGNFNISGTGIAATLQGTSAVLSPLFDTPTAGVLNIGTTNATAINLNKNVTVSAGQYISLVGGITSTRPASPTAGMLYYDTTTNRLLVYSNSKWQADRSTATKIVADGSTSQNPDSADFVVPAASISAQTIINNAIAALPASGGTVYLAEGTYTVSGSINLPSNVTLAGAGAATVIKQANGTNLSVGLIQNSDSTNGNDHITIRDLKLDGNKTNQTSGSANGVKFVKVGAGSTTVGAHLLNLWAENFTDVGYQLNNSSRLTVTGVSAHFNNNNGLSLSGTSYSTITGSNLSDNTNSLASGIVLSSAAANNTISGNVLNDNGNGGIVLAGGSTGNTVSGNTITDNKASSVGVNSSNGNTISGNIIKSSGTNGIRVSTGSENLIDSNLIADSGQTAAGSDAIELVNTSLNNTVSNNKLSDTAGTGAAIMIDALSTGNILIANSIGTGTNGVWNSGGPISDAATGTIYKSQTDVSGNNRSSSAKTSGFFQSANSANNTDATIVSRVQGSATADLIQAQDSSGNALFKVSSTGTVTIGKTNTTGTLIVNSASGGTVTLAAGATASGSSYQLTLPTAIGSAGQCLSVASAASGVAQLGYANCITTVTTTLQNAYDNSTSPASVLLGDAKDFVLTAADTATDPNILFNLQCVTSCGSNGRFAVQNAGTDVMAVNPNGTVVVGSAANGITLSVNGVTLTGSARQAKVIQLTAEYAGAVLDTGATGNNTGTMTSGYDMTARMNYYKWTTTQSTPQSYDVVAQIPIPSDFDSWNGALSFNVYTSDVTNGTIKAQVINSSGGNESGCNFVNITPGSTNSWTVNSGTCTLSSGSSYVAGNYFTLRLRLQSPQSGDVRVGNVLIYYKNKF